MELDNFNIVNYFSFGLKLVFANGTAKKIDKVDKLDPTVKNQTI